MNNSDPYSTPIEAVKHPMLREIEVSEEDKKISDSLKKHRLTCDKNRRKRKRKNKR